MLILGLESSARSASVALSRDGALLALNYQMSGLTHSRTLLPMAEEVLRHAGVSLREVDAIAVAHGPGSFTGIRIGVATAKGLCWGADKPAIGVSTLEAMAYGGAESAPPGARICCAMDARRNQIYHAMFHMEQGVLRRLTPDRAIALEELNAHLEGESGPVYILGDGAALCHGYLYAAGRNVLLAPEGVRMQNAWGVCLAAEGKEPGSAAGLLPVYLRLSQAERERLERLRGAKAAEASGPGGAAV